MYTATLDCVVAAGCNTAMVDQQCTSQLTGQQDVDAWLQVESAAQAGHAASQPNLSGFTSRRPNML